MVDTETNLESVLRFPTLVRRYYSTVIDSVLLFILLVLPSATAATPETQTHVRIIIFVGFLVFYEPLLVVYACTLGQLITGIRVRRAASPDQRISAPRSYLRYAVKIVLGVLSLVTVLFTPRARALHDFCSESLVIRLSRRRRRRSRRRHRPCPGGGRTPCRTGTAEFARRGDRRLLLIANTFFDSLGRLAVDEKARVLEFIDRFQENPAHPSLSLERLGGKSGFWSGRISQDLRAILARTAKPGPSFTTTITTTPTTGRRP